MLRRLLHPRLLSTCSNSPTLRPPRPKKTPFTVSAHGRSWPDPFHWMRDTSDPDLAAHLRRENAYADAFMEDARGLRRKLLEEMRGRMADSVAAPPEKWAPWLYYQYIPEKKEYPVFSRKLANYEGFGKFVSQCLRNFDKEEILLDWNAIAEQFGYVHIGTCRVSPDHKFLAYTVDTSGDETFILQVKDLQTGVILQSPKIEGVISLAWAQDSSYLLYTTCDQTLRPSRVFCKYMGSELGDALLFEENDTSCCVDITSTKDNMFITVYVTVTTDSRIGLFLVRKRAPGVQYFLEHHNGYFYILTNAPSEYIVCNSGNYRLVRCRTENFHLNAWQDIILPSQDITLEDMDMFEGHLVLFLQQKGIPVICSINMPIDDSYKEPRAIEDLHPWFFPMPTNMCSVTPGSNHDFFTRSYRVIISSPMMPETLVDYHMSKKTFEIVHQEEVPGLCSTTMNPNTDKVTSVASSSDVNERCTKHQSMWRNLSEAFICERKEVVSHDGVKVPLTILHSRMATCNDQSPGLLHGYGAYGDSLDKSWCPDRISLLSRGWVIAFADVRGGSGSGEGTAWHKAGIGSNKFNSIRDFVASAKYLVDEGYVHKDRLCAIGCSAGGLLVGATINIYPELFNAAILKVPFLDICNTMLDPDLPLTLLDYEEFGDPRIEADFENLLAYSPYDNISSGVCLPQTLVTASFKDSRVGVWEAAKWVAKVRENACSSCSRSVILRTNMTGGHFGEGGRYKHCEDTAFEYAFLIKSVGMLYQET